MTSGTQASSGTPERNAAVLAALKTYLALGWSVIPVPAGTKTPEIKWAQWAKAAPGKPEWTQWWRTLAGCNLAVVYSASAAPEGKQLVCVDTDSPEAEAWVCGQRPLPPTATARTAKGFHRYYYAPAGLLHSSGGDGLPEVRAGVHYSILPPSLHPTGILYEWVDSLAPEEAGIADLPPWGVVLMGQPGPEDRQDAEAVQTDPVPEGRRNDTVFRLCAKWRSAEVPDGQLRQAAHKWNAANCIPPMDAKEVDGIVDSVLRYAPGTSARVQEKARQAEYAQAEPIDDVAAYYAQAVEDQAAQAVNAITPPAPQGNGHRLPGARPIEEYAEEIIDRADARRHLPHRLYGMRTGWPTLDWHTLGLKFQGVVWVGGESGSSKSTIMRHITFASCEAIQREDLGTRVLSYVLEGGKEQFLPYFAGWKYGLRLALFAPGGAAAITPDEEDLMAAAMSEFPLLPLDVEADMHEAERILWDIERRLAEGGVEGVLIDNVNLLEFGGGNEWVANKKAAAKALALSDKYDVPIVALSQINQTRDGRKPRGGPEWYNNATAAFVVERGEPGDGEEQRKQSNKTRIANLKLRYDWGKGCCRPLVMLGDRATGRLFEEETTHAPRASGAGQEGREWPGNG